MFSGGEKSKSQRERVLLLFAISIIIGFVGTVLFALQASSVAQALSIIGVALMVAGASLMSGGLLGFLFCIPRTLQQDLVQQPSQNREGGDAAQFRPQGISYQVNTNLEQISDWLTKILVGVGLTQISALPGALQGYADFTSSGLGDFPNSKVFAIAALIYFLVCGFLTSYLWTRLYLAGALRQADLASVGILSDKLTQVENKVTDLENQAEIDAKALSCVQRQLNPPPGSPPVLESEIVGAIKLASPSVKAQIFYLAQNIRRENWKDRETKHKMERTIPIFRALIATDTENVYHANHGQLGYALKDQRQPDWAEAESELSKAIEIRGPWQERGWLMYEFNRAICRMHQDPAFSQGKGSDEKAKQAILVDLDAASNASAIDGLVTSDPTISGWLALNDIHWAKRRPVKVE
jgi:hypothetical protein